jgi:hypothetical protein
MEIKKRTLLVEERKLLPDLDKKDVSYLKFITLVGQLGLVMIINIILWFFLCRWIISIIGLNMDLQILGILPGILGGGYSCYHLLKKHLTAKEPHE